MERLSTTLDVVADRLSRLRNRHFFALDVLALLFTPALALMLRLDAVTALQEFSYSLAVLTALFTVVKVATFRLTGLYQRYWRYAGIDELARIVFGVLLATLLQSILFLGIVRPFGLIDAGFPRSVPLLDGLLTLLAIGGLRFSVRLAERIKQRLHTRRDESGENTLIFGAGDAGIMIVEEMRSNPELELRPVGFVDDDPEKQRMRIRGLNVLGMREDLPRLVRETEARLVIIATPRASGQTVREIAEICEHARVKTKTIPGVYELLDGKVSVRQLRDVQVEDLLRRRPVDTETAKVGTLLRGTRVLVTGGGGSIGSELCRQILSLHPDELLLLGHGENSIFRIERELRKRLDDSPALQATTTVRSVIADIRDRDRLEQVFAAFRPQVVFHAAAHKHVPLMEANVEEAVTNNIQGTRQLLQCAEAHDTDRFILISTDKAVNPTSIMGATKRVAEMLVRDAALRTGRAYTAVRFGNVLGSRGSVLEVFRDQITQGGPLTVTHPEVRRYFMTIPEAVHLVLQAAALGDGGEVFLLDMGEPTRIIDLARDLIRLSGMEEGRDIDIVFTGLRPGEKLFEELSMDDETFAHTEHEKIMVCTPNGDHAYATWSEEQHERLHWEIDRLVATAREGDAVQLVYRLTDLVPDYADEKRERLLERLEQAGTEAQARLRANAS